jgi:hypothetical protein
MPGLMPSTATDHRILLLNVAQVKLVPQVQRCAVGVSCSSGAVCSVQHAMLKRTAPANEPRKAQ